MKFFVSHVSARRPDKLEPEMALFGQIDRVRFPSHKASGSVVVDAEV